MQRVYLSDLILGEPDKTLAFHHRKKLMAQIIGLAGLQGEQMGTHRLTAHTAQYGTERAQVLQLNGRRTCYDKQKVHRKSIFRAKFNALATDAQGDMHLINTLDLPVRYRNTMANPSGLYALTTKHASFEAFKVRQSLKY